VPDYTVVNEEGQWINPPDIGAPPPGTAPEPPPSENEQPPQQVEPTTPREVIPPPPTSLTPVARMEYEATYAKEHGLPPPNFAQEDLRLFQEQRGYMHPSYVGADIVKEPEKYTQVVRDITGIKLNEEAPPPTTPPNPAQVFVEPMKWSDAIKQLNLVGANPNEPPAWFKEDVAKGLSTIDVATAIKAGVSDEDIKKLGITQSVIETTKQSVNAQKASVDNAAFIKGVKEAAATKATTAEMHEANVAFAKGVRDEGILSPYKTVTGSINVVAALQAGVDRDLLAKSVVDGDAAVKRAEQFIADEALLSKYPSLQSAVVSGKEPQEAAKRLYPDEYAKLWKPPVTSVQQIEDKRQGDFSSMNIDTMRVEGAAELLGLKSKGTIKVGEDRWSWWDKLSKDEKQQVTDKYYSIATLIGLANVKMSDWPAQTYDKIIEYFDKVQPTTSVQTSSDFINKLGDAWKTFKTTLGASGDALLHPDTNPLLKGSKKSFEFWYNGLGVATTEGKQKIVDTQETVSQWANEGNVAQRFGKNIASGLYDMVSSMSMVIPLTVLDMSSKPLTSQTIAEAASLGVGLVVMPAQVGLKIAKDPAGGIGYAVGTVAPVFLHPASIAKGVKNLAYKTAEGTLSLLPGFEPTNILSFEIDVARINKPGTMSLLRSRALIEAVERVNSGLHQSEIIYDTAGKQVGTVAKAGHDVKITDIDGEVVGHVSALQRFLPDVVYHVTPDKESFIDGAKKGEVVVGTRGRDFLYVSQQPALAFGERAVIAIRTTKSDIVDLPQKFLDIKDLKARRKAVDEANAKGELPPGIYNVYKAWVPKGAKIPQLEYELVVAKGTKLYPVPETWYAPSKETGTATTEFIHPESGGLTPMMWMATESALKEGRGVYPLAPKYGAQAYQTFVQPLRELISRKGRPIKFSFFPEEGALSPTVSTFRAVEVKGVEAGVGKYYKTKTNVPPGELLDAVTREKAGSREIAVAVDFKAEPVRTLSEVWSEAEYVPKQVVPDLIKYAKDNDALVYGSTINRLFVDNARQPHDADLGVNNLVKAQTELKSIYEKGGLKDGIDFQIKKAKAGEGFEIKVKDSSGGWVTSIDVRSKTSHNAMESSFNYGLKLNKTQVVDGVTVETLGTQLSRQGKSLMKVNSKNGFASVIDDNLPENRLKDAPGFQIGMESIFDKLNKSPEEVASLRSDLELFLGDYATRLQQTLATNPQVKQALNTALGPTPSAPAGGAPITSPLAGGTTSTVTPQVASVAGTLSAKPSLKLTPVEQLRARAEAKALERASKGEDLAKAYEDEFNKAFEQPIVIALDKVLLGQTVAPSVMAQTRPETFETLKQEAQTRGIDVKLVSEDVLKDYAGMNSAAARELGFEMPESTIYVLDSSEPEVRAVTLRHELIEMPLVEEGSKYFEAHKVALERESQPLREERVSTPRGETSMFRELTRSFKEEGPRNLEEILKPGVEEVRLPPEETIRESREEVVRPPREERPSIEETKETREPVYRVPPEEERPPIEERPPYESPVEEPPVKIVLPRHKGTPTENKQVNVPQGSIAWRQGAPWGKEQIKVIAPPWKGLKPDSLLDKKPVGWQDKGLTPEETIQIIGEPGAPLPKDISIDLGVTDIYIWFENGQPKIRFGGKGMQTDVGKRLPSNVQGMSITAIDEARKRYERAHRVPQVSKHKVIKEATPEVVMLGGKHPWQ
jgi:hypothetical protein